jgi:hypothetical protein
MISSQRGFTPSQIQTQGSQNKVLSEQTKIYTDLELSIVLYSRHQTKLINELHSQAHRQQAQTWLTLLADNKRIQELSHMTTILFAAVLKHNQDQAVKSIAQKVPNTQQNPVTNLPLVQGTSRIIVTGSGSIIREESARNQGNSNPLNKLTKLSQKYTQSINLYDIRQRTLKHRPITRALTRSQNRQC